MDTAIVEVSVIPHLSEYARRFNVEQVCASKAVRTEFTDDEIMLALERHYHGDRGDLPEDSFWPIDWDTRLTRFHTAQGHDVWIITGDNSIVTYLLIGDELGSTPSD